MLERIEVDVALSERRIHGNVVPNVLTLMVIPVLAAAFATTSAICSDEPAVTPRITALSFFSPHPVKRMAPTKKRRCIV